MFGVLYLFALCRLALIQSELKCPCIGLVGNAMK